MTLSIVNVFISPLPGPRTSIGWLTLNTFILSVLVIAKCKKNHKDSFNFTLVDGLVVLYLLFNAISLFFSSAITTLTDIRLLFIGGLSYFIVRYEKFTPYYLRLLIHVLGGLAVTLAVISLLQVFIPDLMNFIANDYFASLDSPGIVGDFNRGRLLHWGALILTYPWYFASVMLIRERKNIFKKIYSFLGFPLVLSSMIMSNFRWTFIVFIIGMALFLKMSYSLKAINIRQIFYVVIFCLLAGILGSFIVKQQFGYNIIDRFLLSDSERDVSRVVGRSYLVGQALDIFLTLPLLGVGKGNYLDNVDPHTHFPYNALYDQSSIFVGPVPSHNELFTLLAESGLMGGIFFILMNFFVVKKIFMLFGYIEELPKENKFLLLIIGVSLFSYYLYGLFENINPNNVIYLFMLSGAVFSWVNEPVGGKQKN